MKLLSSSLIVITLFVFTDSIRAQAKRNSRKPPVKSSPIKTQSTTDVAEPASPPAKKNDRTEGVAASNDNAVTTDAPKIEPSAVPAKFDAEPHYSYEFIKPEFVVRRILIEHDENGRGKITFEKKDLDEPLVDPLNVSAASLEKIKSLWDALKFLDSTEDYQSTVRQYAHLGTMRVKLRQGDRQRTAEFNWTENATAAELVQEYKKLGEQFVWIFDISVSRENQPLEAPRLIEKLDGLIKRSQISDAAQMLPLLRELSNDERIPLIARNNAARIVKVIEKQTAEK